MPYQVTGNEFVSLPTIRESDGAVEGLTFLYMQLKGLLEMRGGEAGLIRPYLCVDDVDAALQPNWEREHSWIPSFKAETESATYQCTYLTPVGERAFGLRLRAQNAGERSLSLRVGVKGSWVETLHEINETTRLGGERDSIHSGWNQLFIWSQRAGVPLFAFAPCVSDTQPFSEIDQGAQWTEKGFAYDIYKEQQVQPGEWLVLDVFFGIGYEGVAAATSAKELLRQGFETLYKRTANWLSVRERHLPDDALTTLLNTNLFFAFFYASGRTLDTEELCMMTSRSPRYYVSAAYWDRDSLLWAFPAILTVDAAYARELLEAVFTRQWRNFGVHSRFIDGTVLEPGFELDELCAPVVALGRYVDATGDDSLAREPMVQRGLRHIVDTLATKRNVRLGLYETFLQPTDDMHNHPYLTYDNALVCHALRVLARLLERSELEQEAERVRRAVYEHCVREESGKRFFAWSVGEDGRYDIYDEPPGSLQLLPFYGFCAEADEIWQTTIAMIRNESYPLSFAACPIAEIGCKHAPHPWILSICNSLLSGHVDTALAHLRLTRMDNGVACESVNEETGICETGEAFATCAGFLSFALERSAALENSGMYTSG